MKLIKNDFNGTHVARIVAGKRWIIDRYQIAGQIFEAIAHSFHQSAIVDGGFIISGGTLMRCGNCSCISGRLQASLGYIPIADLNPQPREADENREHQCIEDYDAAGCAAPES